MILTVIGARPQFVKAVMVSRAFQSAGIREVILHTGQHYDPKMSDVFFRELGIPKPSYSLGVGSGSHADQTGRMLRGIEGVLIRDEPTCVVVYGDTNSTLAGALAAAKLHIPVAHVEAGLRSFNRKMPEEINRVVTDHISDVLFAPTAAAVQNLRAEGVEDRRVHLVGDVMYDSVLHFADRAEARSDILGRLALESKAYILATLHRAENTDELPRLRSIIEAFSKLSCEIAIVLPLHPRTRAALERVTEAKALLSRVRIIEPLGYLDMLMLERHARLITTDSGGVQKEAFFFRVPCVTLRDETEWIELVALGWNRLAPPTRPDRVEEAIRRGLADPTGRQERPYGAGDAASRIVQALGDEFA